MKCPQCDVQMQPVCPACRCVIPSALIARTKHQQETFHGLVSAFSRKMGQRFETVKAQFKYHHGLWVKWPGPTPWPGQRWTLYKGTPSEFTVFMKSEGAYNMVEETKLIEGAHAECFDVGADIEWFERMQEQRGDTR